MKFYFPETFFVTGTDTGVGKTYVSALLARGLGAYYWKPVQSGSVEGLDSRAVMDLAGLEQSRIIPEVYVFKEPVSPHLAARMEGVILDSGLIGLGDKPVPLVIEGAGGVMVPLNEQDLIIDLLKKLAVPVLVVAPNRLGVINQTLLTLQALKFAAVDVLGVILNMGRSNDHQEAIERFSGVPVLAQLEKFRDTNPEILRLRFNELFL